GNVHVSIPPKESGPVKVTPYLPPNYSPKGPSEVTVDPAHPPAPGSSSAGSREVGFFLGGFFPAAKLSIASGLDTGLRAGWRVHPKWSVEGEAGMVFTDAAGTDGLLGHLTANVLWHAGSAS